MFKNEQVNRSPGASAIMNSVYILEDEFAHWNESTDTVDHSL